MKKRFALLLFVTIALLAAIALEASASRPSLKIRIAAEFGDINAQVKLADAYLYGTGIKKDLSESIRWYQRAANNGNAEAETQIGSVYLVPKHYGNPSGFNRDQEKA
ncbi:MAG: hypothetical protein WCD70_08040, partial [Alphaproteobacteria bacterium]